MEVWNVWLRNMILKYGKLVGAGFCLWLLFTCFYVLIPKADDIIGKMEMPCVSNNLLTPRSSFTPILVVQKRLLSLWSVLEWEKVAFQWVPVVWPTCATFPPQRAESHQSRKPPTESIRSDNIVPKPNIVSFAAHEATLEAPSATVDNKTPSVGCPKPDGECWRIMTRSRSQPPGLMHHRAAIFIHLRYWFIQRDCFFAMTPR